MNNRSSKQRGAALVTAIFLSLILSMMLGGALLYSQNNNNLGYANSRSESALHMAEAGIDNEVQFIAANIGATSTAGLSSQPTVGTGETSVSPFTNSIVLGRKGTISTGNANFSGNYWVYTTVTNPATTATPVGWNGVDFPLWIVSTANVNGVWRRTYVQTGAPTSLFSLYAVFAIDAVQGNNNAIGMQNATVTVTGNVGTNGKVSNSSSTFTATNCIDAFLANTSTQFSSSNVAAGGTLYTQNSAVIFPTVTTIKTRLLGKTWTQLSTSNSNSTGIYTYKSGATSAVINTTDCSQVASPVLNNMLANVSTGQYTNSWLNANPDPTSGAKNSNIQITGASFASPIQITTAKNHGLTSGAVVKIFGVAGNGAANGTWTITSTGNKTFTLNGSAGSGAYTSGGAWYQIFNISAVNATKGGAITVTTSATNGYSSGASITISGTGTQADGRWNITPLSGNAGKTQFTLNGAVASANIGVTNIGTAHLNVIQTLIFEPGDYYFSTVNIVADPTTVLVIDSQAHASGGTPGKVRFWINSNLAEPPTSNSATQNDQIQIPIVQTIAGGDVDNPPTTTADPTLFEIFYSQDKGTFSMQRPSGYVDYSGNSGLNFYCYGEVYAVSKLWGDTGSLTGTTIDFVGIGGSVNLYGALDADLVTFHNVCNIVYDVPKQVIGDPEGGVGILTGYSDGS